MATIIVLTEEALRDDDITRIRSLYPEATFHVLVPADTSRNLVLDFINHLSLLELREAWDSLTHQPAPDEARQEADEALRLSVERLTGAGAQADGHVVADNPLPAVRSEEHTSELQSRFDLVCRLLLEKKKNTN